MPDKKYYCSFCGKSNDEVKHLIAGPGAIFICDDCVDLCVAINREKEKGQAEDVVYRTYRVSHPMLIILESYQDFATEDEARNFARHWKRSTSDFLMRHMDRKAEISIILKERDLY